MKGMTRVLTDGTQLGMKMKGVGKYLSNILGHMSTLDPCLFFIVLIPQGVPPSILPQAGNIEYRFVPFVNQLGFCLWTLPRLARIIRPDVVLVPYETSLFLNGHPYLMVCHDVPAKIREAQERAGKPKGSVREWMRYRIDHYLLPPTLRRADLVFCNSRYVGRSVISDMGVDPSRVRYAPCAPGNDFRRLSRKVRVEKVRLKLGAPEGYVLVFFTGDARENFKVVPEAFECLVNRGISAPLVVAGVNGRFRGMIESAVAGRSWRDKLKIIPFMGAGEEDALAEIYTSASVYLETSLHEGFGMQVVEAMACGTPVVCSNRGALPEVAGEAALMVDPEDAEKVASALAQVLSQKNLREDLKDRGLARSAGFSWAETAKVVLGGLKETAERNRHEGSPPSPIGSKSGLMRLLIITPVYPHLGNPTEGLFVQHQARMLHQKGVRVRVVVCKPWLPGCLARRWKRYQDLSLLGSGEKREEMEVLYVRYLHIPKYRWPFLTVMSCVRAVMAKIQEEGLDHSFDLLQVHGVWPTGFAAPRLAEALDCPFVITLHIQDPGELHRRNRHSALYREMINKASRVVAVGRPLERFLQQQISLLSPPRLEIIPNGIDLEAIQKISGRRSSPPRSWGHIISVGNLWPVKGLDLNLKALAELDRSGIPWIRYTVVGEGPERRRLETISRNLGIVDRVRFAGRLTHAMTLEAISQADIFSLPSWQEAFGIVYLEAMACGKPVIGCWGQGAEDIIRHRQEGMLVRPRDGEDLAKALGCLLADASWAWRLGEAGRARAREFTWERNVEQYLRIYGGLCSPPISERIGGGFG